MGMRVRQFLQNKLKKMNVYNHRGYSILVLYLDVYLCCFSDPKNTEHN